MTTVKHWLEAVVGNQTEFRVVCDNPAKCAEEQGYGPGHCIFIDQFKELGVDMIGWGIREEDIVIGKTEVVVDWEVSEGEQEAWIRKPE